MAEKEKVDNIKTSKLIQIVCDAVGNQNDVNGISAKQVAAYIRNKNGENLTMKQISYALKYALKKGILVANNNGLYKIQDNEEDKCGHKRRKCTRMWRPKKSRRSRSRRRRSKRKGRSCRSRKRRHSRRRKTRSKKRCGGKKRRRRSHSRRRKCQKRRPRRKSRRCSTCTKMWTPKMMGKRRRGKKCEDEDQNQDTSNVKVKQENMTN